MTEEPETIRIKELNLELIQPNTETFMKPDQGGQKTIVVGKPGCLARDTPVLLYNGDVIAVQDVKVGDLLMGPDSQPRRVLELCRGREEMFTIRPDHGQAYTVNLKHILVFRYEGKMRTMTVEEFNRQSPQMREACQLIRTEIHFPYRTTNMDPYHRGATSRQIIPREYKINSRQVRLEFLAGAIDNNGRYDNVRHRFVIRADHDGMRRDLLFLARGLGFAAEIVSTSIEIWGGTHAIPCRAVGYSHRHDENHLFPSFTVHSQNVAEYYGFVLDGDHLFVLESCDVLHNTGKTTLIASLLYAKKHIFPVAMAMSGTEDSNHFYRSVLPSTFVFNNYDENQITTLIKRQKIAKEHVENPWAIMILDDCTDDPAVFRKPLQQGLYKRGRHWKMWYILSLQYGMDVRPVIRTNVDGVFILREPNLRNRKVMWENYGGIIPEFKLFCDILDQITDDYTALYIHNATKTNDWHDCVFWYKARPIPKDFKFGCPTYWDHHFQRYDPEYVDPIV